MKERIARWAADKEYAELREMFGVATFLHLGNFFAADDGGDLVVRLSEEDEAQARRIPKAKPWKSGGPGTNVYTRIPFEAVVEDGELHAWLEKALAFVQTLEPKERLINKKVMKPDFLESK